MVKVKEGEEEREGEVVYRVMERCNRDNVDFFV